MATNAAQTIIPGAVVTVVHKGKQFTGKVESIGAGGLARIVCTDHTVRVFSVSKLKKRGCVNGTKEG